MDPSEWGVGAMAGGLDEAVPVLEGEGTARLALVDMDWEHVKAVDILMVLRSFLAEVHPPPQPPLQKNPTAWPPFQHSSHSWPAQWLLLQCWCQCAEPHVKSCHGSGRRAVRAHN